MTSRAASSRLGQYAGMTPDRRSVYGAASSRRTTSAHATSVAGVCPQVRLQMEVMVSWAELSEMLRERRAT